MKNLVEELRWRGMVQDIMPGTEEQLTREMTTGYIGFDPTADSLHIGNLVPIILLIHLQKCGHRPIALVGGATGMVGDPSGKSEERNLLSEETLNHNLERVKIQLERFLDFDTSLPNAAVVVNNYDWFRQIGFLEFIRDTGKHITVNYMMSKDSVRKRLDSENGMSFTEFTYQLVQGYDYYWLYKNMGCRLQMGGSDQWGNIVTGTELIRKKLGGEAFAITCPLITKADGGKFGKSEQGNIWLDASRTSAYQFYQFWLNSADEDAIKYIRIFTFLDRDAIDEIISRHKGNEHERVLQKRLAEELTCFVHGREAYQFALKASGILFNNDTADILRELNETQLLQVMEGVPAVEFPRAALTAGLDLVSFLAETKIFPSKGEARKMVQGGGVSINKVKAASVDHRLDEEALLNGRYLLVQKGRKNYYLVKMN
jgi:tyrosyl-tRNA synthetase